MKKIQPTTIFKATRDTSDKKASNANDKNRLWWETMPMTYKRWEEDNRQLSTLEDFIQAEEVLFSNSPYLRNKFNFSAYSSIKLSGIVS